MTVENISAIVWVVFAGVCFAAFYAFYQRRIVGDLVRSLIQNGADCPENAKTLAEVGYGSGIKRRFAERVLKKGSVLRKSVEATEEIETDSGRHHPDELFVKKERFSNDARFYIPEEKRPNAEVRYEGNGTTVSSLLLTVAVFFAAAVLIIALLPRFTEFLQNIGKKNGQNGKTEDITIEKPISENEENTDTPQDGNELSEAENPSDGVSAE